MGRDRGGGDMMKQPPKIIHKSVRRWPYFAERPMLRHLCDRRGKRREGYPIYGDNNYSHYWKDVNCKKCLKLRKRI